MDHYFPLINPQKSNFIFIRSSLLYKNQKQTTKKKQALNWVFYSKKFIPRTKTRQFSCRRVLSDD